VLAGCAFRARFAAFRMEPFLRGVRRPPPRPPAPMETAGNPMEEAGMFRVGGLRKSRCERNAQMAYPQRGECSEWKRLRGSPAARPGAEYFADFLALTRPAAGPARFRLAGARLDRGSFNRSARLVDPSRPSSEVGMSTFVPGQGWEIELMLEPPIKSCRS